MEVITVMEYVDIRSSVALGAHKMKSADIYLEDGREYSAGFARQKTGYGEKMFFICPVCGAMRERLYISGEQLLCRECYPEPIYKSIKNVSVGSCKYLTYRMKQLAKKEKITIKRLPFCYLDYEKPRYRHLDSWLMVITKLQALENMRMQDKRYSREVINSIFEEKNQYLFTLDLYDIYKYVIDWEAGCRNFKKMSKS